MLRHALCVCASLCTRKELTSKACSLRMCEPVHTYEGWRGEMLWEALSHRGLRRSIFLHVPLAYTCHLPIRAICLYVLFATRATCLYVPLYRRNSQGRQSDRTLPPIDKFIFQVGDLFLRTTL